MNIFKDVNYKELIEGITDIVRVSTARKDELLSRLEAGQKAIAAMNKFIKLDKSGIEGIEFETLAGNIIYDYEQVKTELKTVKLDSARLIVQEEMYENSKCCGNCGNCGRRDDIPHCGLKWDDIDCSSCCTLWKSDLLKRSKREIK